MKEIRRKIYKVMNDEIEIEEMVDIVNGEVKYNRELEIENINKLYGIYRKKHNLLYPDEIKTIREKYKLTQEEFSIILGFNKITIRRLENGSLQSEEQDRIIRYINSVDNLIDMLNSNKFKIDKNEFNKLFNKLKKINIQDEVTKLLDRAGIVNPPVIIDDIVFELGIKLYKAKMKSNDILGVFKNNSIYINQQQSKNAMRFTIAHEIGHIIMEGAKENITYERDIRNSKPSEVVANNFAAELLVPTDFLIDEVKKVIERLKKNKINIPRNKDLILEFLCELFMVSYETMYFRIMKEDIVNKMLSDGVVYE